MKALMAILVLLFVTACGPSFPAPDGRASMASYVGDTGSMDLGEVVVSIPVGQHAEKYKNLHVTYSAIINTQNISMSDRYDVMNIARRSKVRISAAIVEQISAIQVIRANGVSSVRSVITGTAQQTFDSIFKKWKNADDFKVELVVTSIYFTDGSVGKSATGGHRGW